MVTTAAQADLVAAEQELLMALVALVEQTKAAAEAAAELVEEMAEQVGQVL
jgi:hypothetical protein